MRYVCELCWNNWSEETIALPRHRFMSIYDKNPFWARFGNLLRKEIFRVVTWILLFLHLSVRPHLTVHIKWCSQSVQIVVQSPLFLVASAKWRKATVSFVLSVRVKQHASCWHYFDEIFCLRIFRKSVRKKLSSLTICQKWRAHDMKTYVINDYMS